MTAVDLEANRRTCLSNLQTQALVSLLTTINATGASIDIASSPRDIIHIYVTVWRHGDPTTWSIHLDGTTKEINYPIGGPRT